MPVLWPHMLGQDTGVSEQRTSHGVCGTVPDQPPPVSVMRRRAVGRGGGGDAQHDVGGGGGNSPTIPRNNQHNPRCADYWAPLTHKTAHAATFSTAPAHQPLGSANAETTPAGAPAAAADRTQRPDATCEGKTG